MNHQAEHYFFVQNSIFDANLSCSAKLVYIYLSRCADCFGKSWPSHKRIAEGCSLSVTSIKEGIKELKKAGILTVSAKYRENGGKSSNLYMLMDREHKNSFRVDSSLFTKDISAKAKLVYLYFCRCAGQDATCFPAHKTTAEKCAMAFSTVRKAVKELLDSFLIKTEARTRKDNGQTSNLYTILGMAVEQVKTAVSHTVQEIKKLTEKAAGAAHGPHQEGSKKPENLMAAPVETQAAEEQNIEEVNMLRRGIRHLKSYFSREHRQSIAAPLFNIAYERTKPRVRIIQNEELLTGNKSSSKL